MQSPNIPRIDIRKTVTNDICLILNRLAPTKDIARLIRNYDTFFLEYLAEMRLLGQIINRQFEISLPGKQLEIKTIINDALHKSTQLIDWLTEKGSLLR